MIANGSASKSRTVPTAGMVVSDSYLICSDCNSPIAVEDLFCQECGVTLKPTRTVEATDSVVNQAVQQAHAKFDFVSSTKRSAMLIGVVVAIILSVFAVMAIAGSYDAMSEDYICEHARKLLSENDSIQAAEILQRLYLARGNKLKQQTRDLLGQALIRRSDLYAGRNQCELAVKDLKDVPANTAQSSVATEKLSKLALPAVPAISVPESVKRVSPEPVAVKAKTASAGIATSATKLDVPRMANNAAKDVSNYNKLLTAYFEKAGSESETSSDADADELAKEAKPVREPPTLKEWVKAGRPDF